MKEFYEKDSRVAITCNQNEAKAVREALDLIGAKEDIMKDDIVVITPNWVNNQKTNPSDGVVVGPDTFRSILQWIKEQHPKRIIVATGSGTGNTRQVMEEVGYDHIIKEEGVEFIDFNEGPYLELALSHKKPSTTKVNQILREMTYYISFTQLKSHEEATMSASIKNMAMSWPSTQEHGAPKKNLGIHDDLHGFIAAMAEKIRINLAIVSANPVMVGSGPTNGIAKHTGLVICGKNPIAVDSICGRLLGFLVQGIGYLYLLKRKGFQETTLEKISILGLTMEEAEKNFSRKVYGEEMILDKK